MSFMTRAELLVWPKANRWGEVRRKALINHVSLYTTLLADERTCEIWSEIVAASRLKGRPIQETDAWIAATALQWELPLVTADYRDFDAVDGLDLIRVS